MERKHWAQEIGTEELGKYAEALARGVTAVGEIWARRLSRRVRRALKWAEDYYLQAGRRAVESGHLIPAAEWLLDNWYMAQREGLAAAADFCTAVRLPAERGKSGSAVVWTLAAGAVAAGPLTAERLAVFLAAVQETAPLSENEFSLFVPAMKGALVERLAVLCSALEEAIEDEKEQRELAKAMEVLFGSLRFLAGANLTVLLEEASRVERYLRQDPAGVYPYMDDESRGRYRREVCRLARRAGLTEGAAAERLLELAEQGEGPRRHVGWYLFREPMGNQLGRRSGALYVAAVLLPTLFITLLAGFLLGTPVVALMLLPVSDIVKNLVDFLAVRLFRPRYIHRMDLKDGVPEEGKTLCVVTTLLTGVESGGELAALLERYRLANRDAGKELLFGILADLPDSGLPMGTAAQGYVDAAKRAINGLNETYGGGFYLFFRTPVFQPADERYMGWERKRGALLELCRLLRGRRTGLRTEEGDPAALAGVRFVITLDSDTRLNVGAAAQLVGAMLHPLNTPQVDPARRLVTSGYGLLQPRVGVELEAANRSQFSRIFAGQGGVDPYGSAASDVYHDLFDQGTYTGKGIFDVDAFLTCLDGRLPTGCILSHDLLEGSYLHGGFLGDLELTDSYPYKVTSYYQRLHRWVRGDWQLLPWLGEKVRNEVGEKVTNPIPSMAKWKIFDNLRRSMSPVCTLLALVLGMCVSGPAFAAAAAVAVLAAASNLLLSGADLAMRFGRGLRTRYHSTIIAGFGGVILQTLVQLLLLPYHAWICFSAAITALWRMCVTRRDLLAWVTAADAERRAGDSILANYRRQWFSVVTGAVAMTCAILPAGAAAGLLWTLSPLIAWALSRPIRVKRSIPGRDRAFLLHEGGLIWRYFRDNLRAQDHWLPPDNYQEQPPLGLARRTSPTNIGMAMLSVLAAADLEFLPKRSAAALLGHMMDAVEALPKWNGHLYNWYDTASAAPLEPRYVSTVDSGNLCGCLIALREGLYEWGEGELARRAERLDRAMDFSLLYDRERRLFFIGYDVSAGAYTQGWYDLMASEARQTSYLAVAKGQVPPRHWRQLGRMLVKENDYTGMVSWTGTMFEYFMPNLLLPCEPNSLVYESLAFCLYAQRRAAGRAKVPWGISESGFYAFDAGMSYQYKAHGVQKLGLKRGLDRELVVAPYATFLALLLAPENGSKNLRRLRDMGLEGKYGLYEAADFTTARRTGERRWEAVRSYMAHHLGMSLVAVDNVLNENIMQRRFMRDPAMGAFRELLQEKVPVGAAISRLEGQEPPDKPARNSGPVVCREGTGYSSLRPVCHLLTNGSYSVLCTDAGFTASNSGKLAVTLARPGETEQPSGVSFFLRLGNGTLLPLTAAPLYREGDYSWRFFGDRAVWMVRCGDLRAEDCLRLGEENGELWEIILDWQGEEPLEGELICYLEPVLAPQEDYDAHPAFSKLALESRFQGDGVLFSRRGGAELAILWDGSQTGFTTSREDALGRGGLRALEQALKKTSRQTVGAVLDPCLLVRFPVMLQKGEHSRLRLALGVGEREEDAASAAQRLLRMPKGQQLGRQEGMARACGLSRDGIEGAFRLLAGLAYPALRADGQGEVPNQESLWPFGISGDLPIAVYGPTEREKVPEAMELLRQHRFLSWCGFSFDAVVLLREGGDYRRPVYRELSEGLRSLGAEGQLGARGGVHLIDMASPEEADPILAAAAVVRRPGEPPGEVQGEKARPFGLPPFALAPGLPEYGFGRDGAFLLHTRGSLPPVGWNHILCNRRFGWMTDETGCGHLWYRNAREDPLTVWGNDPLAVGGAERVLLERDGHRYSIFADGDGLDCQVRYVPGEAVWEKEIGGASLRVTAFTDADAPARVLRVEWSGEGRLIYRFTPKLTPDRKGVRFAECVWREDHLAIQNPWSRAFWPQTMLVAASETPISRRREAGGAVEMVYPMNGKLTLAVGCAASKEEECAVLALRTERAFAAALKRTGALWAGVSGAIQVETPDQGLNSYLNGWAPYQIVACRLWGRTSRYQSGGAYGFRDQLQDACGALYFAPKLAEEQLLRCCAHQFEEGDVQHWWHETLEDGPGRGVRTRISDDLLWLPYTLCEYVEKTGDRTILDCTVPYLTGSPLEDTEGDRYELGRVSREIGDVYDHARRAVEQALARGNGQHGLALMGGGDWNDGMNRVGAEGRGESVWLTWFLVHVLERFAPLAEERGQSENAVRYLETAERYRAAATDAWDGEWFLRGYYDNGIPLGSRKSSECQIDSIAQSWAVLAGCGDEARVLRALRSALEHLWDKDRRLVKLFTPPFSSREAADPGYIADYVPGVRENGGQYTHAAVWLAIACLRAGLAEEGWELLRALLPSGRDTEVYRGEPYVLSADVYTAAGHVGRGGWSWYTGAAGWYYRGAVEELLGLRMRKGRLYVEPRLPDGWPGYTVRWRTGIGELEITVIRDKEKSFTLDGREAPDGVALRECKGKHRLVRKI